MYVDVLLLENLIINYLLLNITSRFSKIKTAKSKLLIGSVVGALYVLIVFFPSYQLFYILPLKIAVSALMITVAFTPERLRDFFRILGIFYIISFAFGGAAFALFYFTGKGQVMNGMFYIKDFPLSLLITSFAIGYLLLAYCWGYIQKRALKEELKYTVNIKLDGKEININTILDTGNSLKDPITSFPVIVVEYEAISSILPEKLSLIFEKSDQDIDFIQLYKLIDNTDWVLRIRLIPFTSLGKQNGMLVGIKPDVVELQHENESLEIRDVIIGVCNNKLSQNGEYNGLLYPEILK